MACFEKIQQVIKKDSEFVNKRCIEMWELAYSDVLALGLKDRIVDLADEGHSYNSAIQKSQ